MTVRLRDLLLGLRELHLRNSPVIVHSSLKSFGSVEGGADTVVNALARTFDTVVVPTFTYKTMLIPLTGPADNAMTYRSSPDANRMAEFFTPKLPSDSLMGIIPETLRKLPRARRSIHPIQSFAGLNAEKILATQTLSEPLAPLGALEARGGWVLLLGVDHTVDTSIHFAEKLAGRKRFVRWALTPKGVVECPGFPGDSAGFQAIAPDIDKFTRSVKVGDATIQAIPITMLFKAVIARIKKDPLALLCEREDCERCGEIRRWVQNGSKSEKSPLVS
jgi:aminoglycoside 3-N-acetyltransferase